MTAQAASGSEAPHKARKYFVLYPSQISGAQPQSRTRSPGDGKVSQYSLAVTGPTIIEDVKMLIAREFLSLAPQAPRCESRLTQSKQLKIFMLDPF